jgi:DNA polymerase
MRVPVYDIVNCGPRRRFVANGKLVHNSDKVNLQNLPSRGANAGAIKGAIECAGGYVIIDCDSSQIEARVLAWLAGQTDLVQAFAEGRDVYKLMASRIYGKPPEEITPEERFVGKTVTLGAGYGIGHAKLLAYLKLQAKNQGIKLDLDAAEAKRIVDAYRAASYKIVALWKRAGEALKALQRGQSMTLDEHGLVRVEPGKGFTLPNGLHIQYPELRGQYDSKGKVEMVYTSKGLPVRIYGGKNVENLCQAIARCIIGEQMLKISKRYKPVLTVHDAIAVVAPKAEAHEAMMFVMDCMSWTPKWAKGLPLACEAGYATDYGNIDKKPRKYHEARALVQLSHAV